MTGERGRGGGEVSIRLPGCTRWVKSDSKHIRSNPASTATQQVPKPAATLKARGHGHAVRPLDKTCSCNPRVRLELRALLCEEKIQLFRAVENGCCSAKVSFFSDRPPQRRSYPASRPQHFRPGLLSGQNKHFSNMYARRSRCPSVPLQTRHPPQAQKTNDKNCTGLILRNLSRKCCQLPKIKNRGFFLHLLDLSDI